ncbi:MAG: DUF188 domain-containing protein [Treponemataceae bacterium]|nr:DUF188 domain-containing protein [Treponemataceae bacterium]
MFSVWIDADSCPRQVREFVFRRTKKYSVPLFFVANREIPLPAGAQMTVCEPTAQAADDYIFSHCNAGDIIITRDIPFAARLQEKSVCVMNDRGTVFTKENIGERLSERNFMLNLAEIGLGDDRKKSSYGKKEFDAFVRTFDRDFSQKLMFLATRRNT